MNSSAQRQHKTGRAAQFWSAPSLQYSRAILSEISHTTRLRRKSTPSLASLTEHWLKWRRKKAIVSTFFSLKLLFNPNWLGEAFGVAIVGHIGNIGSASLHEIQASGHQNRNTHTLEETFAELSTRFRAISIITVTSEPYGPVTQMSILCVFCVAFA